MHNNPPIAWSHLFSIHVHVCSVPTLTFLACVSSVAGQAKAEEGINLVDASASIFTWLGLAVVNICGDEKSSNKGEEERLQISLGLKLIGCFLQRRCC